MVSSGAEKEGEGWSVQDASGRGIQTPPHPRPLHSKGQPAGPSGDTRGSSRIGQAPLPPAASLHPLLRGGLDPPHGSDVGSGVPARAWTKPSGSQSRACLVLQPLACRGGGPSCKGGQVETEVGDCRQEGLTARPVALCAPSPSPRGSRGATHPRSHHCHSS